MGISEGFGDIDTENLKFPTYMSIDYIRVYQRKDAINIGCDPKDYPTAKYIETCVFLCILWGYFYWLAYCLHFVYYSYKEAYINPNLTVWADYKQPWPKNRLIPGNCD